MNLCDRDNWIDPCGHEIGDALENSVEGAIATDRIVGLAIETVNRNAEIEGILRAVCQRPEAFTTLGIQQEAVG